MKSIALLTFHDTTNFGALLQTFGLYKKLNDLGYNCSILDYQCENIIKREIPEPFKLSINPKSFVSEVLVKSKTRRRYAAMCRFVEKNMPKITQPYNRKTVFNLKEEFDAFVVGSDMCWGLDITDSDYSYFLDFVPDNTRKFSYATSIGKREWTNEELDKITALLSRFYCVSAREDVTANRLKQVLEKPCSVVCDPTMLLTFEEWKPYISNRYNKKDYVLLYFNTDDGKALKDAEEYANKNNKELIVISAKFAPLSSFHYVYPSFIEDFLSLIYYADTVFTASYHGLLFSLYFHKNFIYYNRPPAYRMQTVAKIVGVENREGDRVDFNNLSTIDWAGVDERMVEYRAASITYLTSALR